MSQELDVGGTTGNEFERRDIIQTAKVHSRIRSGWVAVRPNHGLPAGLRRQRAGRSRFPNCERGAGVRIDIDARERARADGDARSDEYARADGNVRPCKHARIYADGSAGSHERARADGDVRPCKHA